MRWMEDLLNQIPSTSQYRLELEAMEKENAALKQENARLKSELEAIRANAAPGSLQGEVEQMLVFISRHEYASAPQIAEALSLTRQTVEMHIDDLLKGGYIEPSYATGDDAEYYLRLKAKRYLHGAGLL
jgi:DNA-binding MarR family transcriptional regulator